jgi:hypothetical protein
MLGRGEFSLGLFAFAIEDYRFAFNCAFPFHCATAQISDTPRFRVFLDGHARE